VTDSARIIVVLEEFGTVNWRAAKWIMNQPSRDFRLW